MPSSKRGARTEPLELNATAASILGFLHKEPQTGWQLAERIEDIIGDFWNVTRSQIYRELKDLAQQGLVASMKTGPRDKQPYRVTDTGRRAFKVWIAERPGRPNMRLPLVLQVFFGDAVEPGKLASSFAELRSYHEGRLATYKGFEAEVPKDSWQYESLRLGLMFQKMMISWIDSLQKRRPSKG